MRARHRFLAVGVSALALTLHAGVAAAQTGEDFAVYPAGTDPNDRPFFAYDVAPGDVIDDVLTIANLAETPRTFALYAADGYNTSDVGTFALRQDDEARVDVGAWTSVATDRWTVPGLTQADIPLHIEVPDDASPGDHVGGVVVLQVPTGDGADEDAFGLTVQRGIGARIYLRVTGPLQPQLAVDAVETERSSVLSPLSSGSATTTFAVTNIGNVRMSPTVSFRATGPWGEIERSDLGSIADLLPGSTVTITHEWSGIPAGGKITQSITLTDGETSYVRDVSFWIVPWWAIVLALMVGSAGALLARWWRRSRRELSEFKESLTGAARVVLLAAVVTPFLGVTAATAASPEVLVRTDGPVEIGDSIVVSGTGWPGRSNLLVEICGNEGAGGSRDCAVTEGRTAATSPDGRFTIELPVALPPAPCPCVVRAWTVSGDSTAAVAKLSILSDPSEDGSGLEPTGGVVSSAVSANSTDPTGALRVDARFEGGDSWRSWLGGAPQRTLVVSVENVSDRRSAASFVSLSWSSKNEPSGFIPLLAIDRLESGMRREYPVDVRFDALTIGEITVRGEMLDGGVPVVFESTTSTYPWGLVAIVLGFLFVVAAAISLRLFRRLAARWARRTRSRAASEVGDLSEIIEEELAAAFDAALQIHGAAAFGESVVATVARDAAGRVAARASLRSRDRRELEGEIARTLLAEFAPESHEPRDAFVDLAALLADALPAHLMARIAEQPDGDTTEEECGRLVAEVSAEVLNGLVAEFDLTSEEAEALAGEMTRELTAVLV